MLLFVLTGARNYNIKKYVSQPLEIETESKQKQETERENELKEDNQ